MSNIHQSVLTKNAITIMKERYLEPNETIDGMFDRVSNGDPLFRKLLSNLDMLPNSPTLMNAHTGRKGTLSACFQFVVGDSMLDGDNSIVATRAKAAACAKWGGGVGYYFGKLRPKSSPISSVHRKACGPVAVLRDYHALKHLITQGGKRDLAQMGILNYDHADIREFIHCKDNDPQGLSSFNISVSWTDRGMNLAMTPGTEENKLWKEQVESAWRTGDPGCYFHDAAERKNPTPWLGVLYGTNPCLTGDTLVAVADGRGAVSIRELAEKGVDVPVYTLNSDGEPTIRQMRHPRFTGTEKIFKVTLDDGYTVRVTGNHKFLLRSGDYVEAQNLQPGDSLITLTRYVPDECNEKSQSYADSYVSLQFKGKCLIEHRLLASFKFDREIRDDEHVHHINGNKLDNSLDNISLRDEFAHLHEHSVGAANANYSGIDNDTLLEKGRQFVRELGRRFSKKEWMKFAAKNGLPVKFSEWREKILGTLMAFSKRCATLEGVDNNADVDPRVAGHYNECLEAGLEPEIVDGKLFINKTCETCGNRFRISYFLREQGVCSRSCANSRRDYTKFSQTLRVTNDKKREEARTHQLEVYCALKNQFGRQPMKKEWVDACKLAGISAEMSRDSSPFRAWDDLIAAAETFNHRVASVVEDGLEDVFNGTVDDFHNFFVGGWEGLTEQGRRKTLWINNLQCGEVPLLSGEACNLGSINLANFVLKHRRIDWDRLHQVTQAATHFLNTILDWNTFPHPDIDKATRLTRKLGLGVMGWADMLALMHIHYDTEEAVKLGKELMSFVDLAAKATSVKLADKFGPYPGFSEEAQSMTTGCGTPHRNATRTCIAPTGTISILAGCSSGIEPHYALEWERTTFEGFKLNERIAVWDKLDGFVPKTAMEIPWIWHVKHQAAFQAHTDLAVSKTINLPHEASPDDVEAAYKAMWEMGCKGGTVFRDRCRIGGEQVLRNTTKSVFAPIELQASQASSSDQNLPSVEELKPTAVRQSLKPPQERKAIIHHVVVNEFDGYLHAGMLEDGTLCEIFITSCKEGSTVAGLLDSWAIAVSYYLQQGGCMDRLVRKYSGVRFEPAGATKCADIPICTSIVDYVVRWLDLKFGRGKEKNADRIIESGMLCPSCHSAAIYQGGCLTCSNLSCGWSRCG